MAKRQEFQLSKMPKMKQAMQTEKVNIDRAMCINFCFFYCFWFGVEGLRSHGLSCHFGCYPEGLER